MVDVEGPVPTPDPVWERRHPSGPESWSFDFFLADGSLGGFVGLTLWPPPRRGWYWAALVGRRRPYLLVRELDVVPPRSPSSREIRAEALWADVNCETPHDHWSLGLEAFGVAMDDPGEALGSERGDRVGLGLDLEWEAAGPVVGGEGGYGQTCAVHGEVLVGGGGAVETLAFDGAGWRRHAWGTSVDWSGPRSWAGGRLDDGTPWSASGVDRGSVSVLHRAPLRLGSATLERALGRLRASDGRSGVGWWEQVATA